MKVINDATTIEKIDAVTPHPRNPRQGDVGAIHQSIAANGFYGQIVAQRSTGHILAGNHRWLAAKQAGAKRVPVTWVDVDDAHALRILLADNRTSDLASNDEYNLAQLLIEIQEATGDLTGTGYDGDDLDDLLTRLELPTPDEQQEPRLDSEHVIEIRCSAAAMRLMEPTLDKWEQRDDVQVHVS